MGFLVTKLYKQIIILRPKESGQTALLFTLKCFGTENSEKQGQKLDLKLGKGMFFSLICSSKPLKPLFQHA